MKKIISILSIIVVLLTSCSKGDSTDSSTANNLKIEGIVTDESNNPIPGAIVKNGSNSSTTDAAGTFTLNTGIQQRVVVEIMAPGFFDGYRGFIPVVGQTQKLNVMMESKGSPIDFTSYSGAVLSNQGGTVSIGPNSVMDASGNTYNGNVTAYLRCHNPSQINFSKIMQGGDFAAESENGATGILTSQGFYSVEMEDTSGNLLNIKTGTTASFSLPIASSAVASADASIKLWSFDKIKGIWKEEGTATKMGNNYVGQVAHFSAWNCDQFNEFYNLKGRVLCNGIGVSKQVVVMDAITGSELTGLSGASGYFCIRVPQTRVVILSVEGRSFTVPAQITSLDYNLGDIETCTPPAGGSGQFIFNGTTYSGFCSSAVTQLPACSGVGIDVVITHSSGASFQIYDMPTASSGTYPIKNIPNTNTFPQPNNSLFGTCNLLAKLITQLPQSYDSLSGSVTKTGANSFTFTCTALDGLRWSYEMVWQETTITGSGTY